MKKVCTSCRNEKSLSDFRKDKQRKDGYQSHCKQCARERHKSAYASKYKVKHKESADVRRARTIQLILEYKLAHPCQCGETEPVCLDFHHLDMSEKDFIISQNKNRSWESLQSELQKCVVLCSNCHRKVHAGILVLDDSGRVV